jgi:chromate transporter
MTKEKFKKCIELFLMFFKIGAFTFGGGYAMIPLIEREIIEKKKYIEKSDLLDIIAISESTPGPIAVNTATFVGYQTAGFLGAIFSTLGVVVPSFVIIFILSFIINRINDFKVIRYAFFGIRAGVVALIIKALISMGKQCPKNILSYVIVSLAFLAVAIFKINVLIIIIASALVGLAVFLICDNKKKEEDAK